MGILEADAAGEQWPPEQLRLVEIQLKPVGLHPAVNLVSACRHCIVTVGQLLMLHETSLNSSDQPAGQSGCVFRRSSTV